MPVIEIPKRENEELSDEAKRAASRLDEIFWQELQQMECRVMLKEIDPVGGKAKAEAVLKNAPAKEETLFKVPRIIEER